jgi:hypothetical protein
MFIGIAHFYNEIHIIEMSYFLRNIEQSAT